MAFEISTLALSTDIVDIHLTSPADGEPLFDDDGSPVVLQIYGTASKPYRNKLAQMANSRLKKRKHEPTADSYEADQVDLLVACSHKALNLTYQGEPIDTPEAFRALYSAPEYMWIRGQIDTAIGDFNNFLEQPKKS